MVYGTSCPRVTSSSGVVLVTVNAPGGVSTWIETLPEALCGGLFQVTTPVLVTVVAAGSVLPWVARRRRAVVAAGASGRRAAELFAALRVPGTGPSVPRSALVRV